MKLSNRLEQIANFVPKESCLADIGTDHAYIPIFLEKNNIIKKCIACDINKSPLENASNHIKKYKIKNIETRLSNGIQNIYKQDNIDTLVISGMGGYSIIEILSNDINGILEGITTLIVQPQNKKSDVRKFLHSIGFKIYAEQFLKEDNKIYTIIVCEKGSETYSECEYIYGKYMINNPNKIFLDWVHYEGTKYKEMLSYIENLQQSDSILKWREEVEQYYKMYKETGL
ncbi:hypothetical protein AN640_03235 [Candidatus Epulonipiscium fishelsonii]|uniref:Uncharacterized protein n=1 Tax=Candidatus Epulonipiscium fishelsonii TaxID=77094 RepID=A0ACC8XJ87_9FIRM|nr:hypothetical protein AN640_03235 [Epulopiscium sp. SCG-D08WGA-EpuloA1]